MRWSMFAVCVLASSAPTSAQTITNCRALQPGAVECQTRGAGVDYAPVLNAPNAGDAFRQGWERGQQQRREQEAWQAMRQREAAEADARMAVEEQAARDRLIRESVGTSLAAGRCDEATQTALRAGNIALANEARMFCLQNQAAMNAAAPPAASSGSPPPGSRSFTQMLTAQICADAGATGRVPEGCPK